LLRKWSLCEDDSASPKEFLEQAKTSRMFPCEYVLVSPKEFLGRAVRKALKYG
jgi:hypothetical protein